MLFSCLLPPATLAQTAFTTVDELLQRASRALQEKNYRGTFTYEFGGVLETLELVHAVREGREYERVMHLNGTAREFVRLGRQKDCVTIGGFLLRGGLISTGAGAVSLSQNYHLYVRGRERIAGRSASVLEAIPKDEYRYGMTIAVDESSGLPLMSTVSVSSQQVLERFQFVVVEVADQVGDEWFGARLEPHQQIDGSNVECVKNARPFARWQATWVPPGFLLSHARPAKRGGDVLTYTDGLSSFSIFVSPLEAERDAERGIARRGATIALMSVLSLETESVNVIFIGEVPAATARRVVASLRPL